MLPTNHGFDEFFGNLYHLNAEEEPENEDYPTNPEFRKKIWSPWRDSFLCRWSYRGYRPVDQEAHGNG